ncbi:hypothetical protein GCM10009834_32300 [Streptomonospora arabica]|uniref:Uncharacterized protein n=1 Tax=Streptomonospora halophila TaxID=427369 RepID=A0ABP9GT86_9ACTN
MGRRRHPDREFEALLRDAENKGWRVVDGKYFKLYCPCPRKCKKTIRLTPSDPNYLRNAKGQLRRATCWED